MSGTTSGSVLDERIQRGDAERKLQEKLNNERKIFEIELEELNGKQFAFEPDAFTALKAFRKSHTKRLYDDLGVSPPASL